MLGLDFVRWFALLIAITFAARPALAHGGGSTPLPSPLAAPVLPVPASAKLVGLKRIATVTVADGPKSIEFLPGGKRLWTNNLYGNRTQLIDTATGDVTLTMTWNGEPVEASFDSGGTEAWVSLYDRRRVLVIDTASGKQRAEIEVGEIPKVVAHSPDGRWVYVANWGHEPRRRGERFTVSVIDAARRERVADLPMPAVPRGIAFTPDGKFAYVAIMGGSSLVKVDVAGGHKIVGRSEAGPGPRHVVADRAGKFLYASLNRGGSVVKYDLATDRTVGRARVGTQPRTIELSTDGRYLFVCNYQDNTLGVVDVATMRQIFVVRTGSKPIGVAVAPDGRRVWVANYASRPSTLWVYEMVYEGEAGAEVIAVAERHGKPSRPASAATQRKSGKLASVTPRRTPKEVAAPVFRQEPVKIASVTPRRKPNALASKALRRKPIKIATVTPTRSKARGLKTIPRPPVPAIEEESGR